MIITYFRSSSYNTHSLCEQQYFIEYVLGWRGPSGQKADKGTIVHKVLEILAVIKQAQQNNIQEINDDVVGSLNVHKYDLDKIVQQVYTHYTERSTHHKWTAKDHKDCHAWVYKAIEFNDGMFDPRNRHILCPEQHFDIEIKKPWSAYSYDTPEGKLEGNLAIKGTIDLITLVNDNTIEIVDWKGLPINTQIPTIDGWKTMGDLTIGDIVFDQQGEQCSVVGKSKVSFKPCYKITFNDTTSVICDNEHLWKLSNDKTVSIMELKVGDKINVSKPISCDYSDLPIDPYVLGVWLGDGRNRSCEIYGEDSEIFDNIQKQGYGLGKNIEKRYTHLKCHTILNTTKILRSLNLLKNKHIPDIYFRASYEQRLALLQGLMDTDGNVNTFRKQAVFTSCNKKLSDDVKHLLLTLGQRPNQSTVKRSTNFKKNITVYPIAFRPIDINPFMISRKASKISEVWGHGASSTRRITKIEKSIDQKTQCISVNSKDNTYLCTENYIPTHNTGRRLDWATGKEKTQEKLESDPQLRIYHYAISHLYPHIDHIIFSIYFINDGGPFSVCFDKSDLSKTEDMLRQKFKIVKNSRKPQLNKSWMCSKLCHFGKTTFDNTKIAPIEEYRNGQLCAKDTTMTKCEQIKHDLDLYGIDATIGLYKHPNHTFGSYKAPGT
jgi:hypothetical protein